MTRIIAVLGMIALCACSGPGPEPTRAAAETALARGQLAEVDRYVAQGLALTAAEPQSVWAWRFKLLGVEAQISRLAIADAENALAAPVPAGAGLRRHPRPAEVSAGPRPGCCRASSRRPPSRSKRRRWPRPSIRELQFDIEILSSQIRFRTGQWSTAESGLRTLIRQAEAGGFQHHQAQALNNLGMGFVVAQPVRRSAAMVRAHHRRPARLDGTTIYGQALNNAGICYARLGQFDRAVASQQKAIDLHRVGVSSTTHRRLASSAAPTCCRATCHARRRVPEAGLRRGGEAPASATMPRSGRVTSRRRRSPLVSGTMRLGSTGKRLAFRWRGRARDRRTPR